MATLPYQDDVALTGNRVRSVGVVRAFQEGKCRRAGTRRQEAPARKCGLALWSVREKWKNRPGGACEQRQGEGGEGTTSFTTRGRKELTADRGREDRRSRRCLAERV